MGYYTTPVLASTAAAAGDTALSRVPFSPFSNKEAFDSLTTPARTLEEEISAIYVCGDSHVLSSAYAVIKPAGSRNRKVLIPKLVTGVKQWHLRKESNFYTKEIFKRTMASVPDMSEVIFLIGEIDCREGILVAVEKGVYKDVQEGMNDTIAVFKQVVRDTIQKKRIKVSG
jgi:hypothetical protein